MKQLIKILTIASAVVTFIFIWLYLNLTKLPYDIEGRYFDEEEAIVYHEQTKELYGLLVLAGLLLTGILTFTGRKLQ